MIIGSNGIIRKSRGSRLDPDAALYIASVQSFNSISAGFQTAINQLFIDLKSEGLLNLIASSCLFANGSSTLNGALVQLAPGAAAVTNFNFLDGDLLPKTGLKGDTLKYINTNFSLDSTYQNNLHMGVWRTEAEETSGLAEGLIGNESGGAGAQITTTSSNRIYRANNSGNSFSDSSRHLGFVGISRDSSESMSYRYNKVTTSVLAGSSSVNTTNFTVFARGGSNGTNARIAAYFIGRNLNLAALESILTSYMNTIQNL
jgi:hypothetical protein